MWLHLIFWKAKGNSTNVERDAWNDIPMQWSIRNVFSLPAGCCKPSHGWETSLGTQKISVKSGVCSISKSVVMGRDQNVHRKIGQNLLHLQTRVHWYLALKPSELIFHDCLYAYHKWSKVIQPPLFRQSSIVVVSRCNLEIFLLQKIGCDIFIMVNPQHGQPRKSFTPGIYRPIVEFDNRNHAHVQGLPNTIAVPTQSRRCQNEFGMTQFIDVMLAAVQAFGIGVL